MLEITPLFSGSSGNSIHIKHGKTELLIDAGVSCRSICNALSKIGSSVENISCVLVTHEHSDHITGLEMMCKKYHTPVYVNTASAKSITSGGRNPYLSSCIKILDPGTELYLNELHILPFRTPHDACGSVGYRINCDDDSFSYATDMGYVTREIARFIFGSKTVIFESNHDVEMLKSGVYPEHLKARILSDRGHLSNDACSKFIPHLAENGAERIILAHLSKDNNTPQKAFEASQEALKNAGFCDVCLEIAKRSILDDEA